MPKKIQKCTNKANISKIPRRKLFRLSSKKKNNNSLMMCMFAKRAKVPWFAWSTLASFHSPKTCKLGELETLLSTCIKYQPHDKLAKMGSNPTLQP